MGHDDNALFVDFGLYNGVKGIVSTILGRVGQEGSGIPTAAIIRIFSCFFSLAPGRPLIHYLMPDNI